MKKVHEGRPHCVDRIRSGRVDLVINTTSGRQALEASFGIRRSCTDFAVPCITEDHAAEALVLAMDKKKSGQFDVSSLLVDLSNIQCQLSCGLIKRSELFEYVERSYT